MHLFKSLLNLSQYLVFSQLVALSLDIVATHKLHSMVAYNHVAVYRSSETKKNIVSTNLKLEILPYDRIYLSYIKATNRSKTIVMRNNSFVKSSTDYS